MIHSNRRDFKRRHFLVGCAELKPFIGSSVNTNQTKISGSSECQFFNTHVHSTVCLVVSGGAGSSETPCMRTRVHVCGNYRIVSPLDCFFNAHNENSFNAWLMARIPCVRLYSYARMAIVIVCAFLRDVPILDFSICISSRTSLPYSGRCRSYCRFCV